MKLIKELLEDEEVELNDYDPDDVPEDDTESDGLILSDVKGYVNDEKAGDILFRWLANSKTVKLDNIEDLTRDDFIKLVKEQDDQKEINYLTRFMEKILRESFGYGTYTTKKIIRCEPGVLKESVEKMLGNYNISVLEDVTDRYSLDGESCFLCEGNLDDFDDSDIEYDYPKEEDADYYDADEYEQDIEDEQPTNLKTYDVLICDGNGAASRGTDIDTYYEVTVQAADLNDAIKQVYLSEFYPDEDDQEYLDDLNIQDFVKYEERKDITGGDAFIDTVLEDGNTVYSANGDEPSIFEYGGDIDYELAEKYWGPEYAERLEHLQNGDFDDYGEDDDDEDYDDEDSEDINESTYDDEEGPYGFEDVKKLISGKGKRAWWFLKEIEMDYGDGKKLADWLIKRGIQVQSDTSSSIDDDQDQEWWVEDEYHWGDCYFYPYPKGTF